MYSTSELDELFQILNSVPPSCIDNPGNKFEPQYIPLTIFNLSKVDYLYIGRDTVVVFADKPAVNVYLVEIASDEKIKEHLAKPRKWVPHHHETLPEIPSQGPSPGK